MEENEAAKILWDYQVLNQKPVKSDLILALGSSDIRTAIRAAELFNDGFGKLLVTTGSAGRLSKDSFAKPEATVFAEKAIKLGVSENKILQEKESSNTFDNLRLTHKHLDERDIKADSFLVVTKPYFERRAYAMLTHFWPNKEITITSPNLTYETYPNDIISGKLLINMLVGDLQRIMVYGRRGDLTRQSIPSGVMEAYELLLDKGYNKQMIDESTLPPPEAR